MTGNSKCISIDRFHLFVHKKCVKFRAMANTYELRVVVNINEKTQYWWMANINSGYKLLKPITHWAFKCSYCIIQACPTPRTFRIWGWCFPWKLQELFIQHTSCSTHTNCPFTPPTIPGEAVIYFRSYLFIFSQDTAGWGPLQWDVLMGP